MKAIVFVQWTWVQGGRSKRGSGAPFKLCTFSSFIRPHALYIKLTLIRIKINKEPIPLETVYQLQNKVGLMEQEQSVEGIWGHGHYVLTMLSRGLIVTRVRMTRPSAVFGEGGLKEGTLGQGSEPMIKDRESSRTMEEQVSRGDREE